MTTYRGTRSETDGMLGTRHRPMTHRLHVQNLLLVALVSFLSLLQVVSSFAVPPLFGISSSSFTLRSPSLPLKPAPTSSLHATTADFADFGAVLKASGNRPLLVDFYADWCGPCKIMSKELDALSIEPPFDKSLDICKIDTDKYGDLAEEYSVSALPTCIVFKKGVPVKKWVGVMGGEHLREALKPLLERE